MHEDSGFGINHKEKGSRACSPRAFDYPSSSFLLLLGPLGLLRPFLVRAAVDSDSSFAYGFNQHNVTKFSCFDPAGEPWGHTPNLEGRERKTCHPILTGLKVIQYVMPYSLVWRPW